MPDCRHGVVCVMRGVVATSRSAQAAAGWVFCDLGTDCHDCGPWQGRQNGPAW